jgi:hypothetical protein
MRVAAVHSSRIKGQYPGGRRHQVPGCSRGCRPSSSVTGAAARALEVAGSAKMAQDGL